MIYFCFKQYLNETKSFSSRNLTHFHLEWIKSNWNRMVHNGNGENLTRTAGYVNRTERAKLSISPMLDGYILKHSCNIFGPPSGKN